MGKIKAKISGKNIIELEEKGNIGDTIDLTEVSGINITFISDKFEKEINILANEKAKQIATIETSKILNSKDKQIALLEQKLKTADSEKEKEIEISVLNTEKKYDKQISDLTKTIQIQKGQLEYRDLGTKAIGENLEQAIFREFKKYQAAGAFPHAQFFKDNIPLKTEDEIKGTKGDFIFKDFDEQGNPILTIEIEVKNEGIQSKNKTKNEHHYAKLDSDRRKKECEYALLISCLEMDNELFKGIYIVREYEKMYVVRPENFISVITFLKETTINKNKELYLQLSKATSATKSKQQFESILKEKKLAFNKDVNHAVDNYASAIQSIDKAIKNLEEMKQKLLVSGKQLRWADEKLQDLDVNELIEKSGFNPFKK